MYPNGSDEIIIRHIVEYLVYILTFVSNHNCYPQKGSLKEIAMKEKDNIAHFVIVGTWNKYILTQEWVANNLLVGEQNVQMQIPINMDASLKFITKDLSISIIKDRFELSIINRIEPIFRKATNIIRTIVRLLPHTPVYSFGINSTFYCSIEEAGDSVQFNGSDIELLAAMGMPLQSQSVTRCLKMSDSNFLNLTIHRDEIVKEVVFDFNYNYIIKSLPEIAFILGDNDNIIIEKREHIKNILNNIYSLTL